MAGKAERALVTGTDNVYDLKRFKALKVVEKYRDEFPWIEIEHDAVNNNIYSRDAEGKLCLGGWLHADFEATDYLGHHKRMVEATNRIKARRDFIDGHSTDS
jgi:hypothetical protein